MDWRARPGLIALIAVLGVAVVGGGIASWVWSRQQAEAERVEREDQRFAAQRSAQEARTNEALERESADFVPQVLRGVVISMRLDELRATRPHAHASTSTREVPGHVFWQETLENGAGVMYGFDKATMRLEQVQVLSMLPDINAVSAHLRAMNETYGVPQGAFDCPNADGVPTRRFAWRRSHLSLEDVFLVYGSRVSVTLYVAPTEVIGASLHRAACTPVGRDHIADFPVADPSQLSQAQGHH